MSPGERWAELHKRKNFASRYPEPEVIRWTYRNFDRSNPERFCLLDVGCGHGRHAAFWKINGYQAIGCDFVDEAVEASREFANVVGFGVCRDFHDSLHWPDNWFHGVLSWGVLYYTDTVERGISELHRVLKPGGKALVNIRSTADSRFLHGHWNEEGCVVAPGPHNAFADEAGLSMKFYTPEKAKDMFRAFSEVNVERHSRTEFDGEIVHDDLIIKATK